MKQCYTTNDLLRYLYNETTIDENLQIEKMLNEDHKLFQLFVDLTEAKSHLDDTKEQQINPIVNKFIIGYASSVTVLNFEKPLGEKEIFSN